MGSRKHNYREIIIFPFLKESDNTEKDEKKDNGKRRRIPVSSVSSTQSLVVSDTRNDHCVTTTRYEQP